MKIALIRTQKEKNGIYYFLENLRRGFESLGHGAYIIDGTGEGRGFRIRPLTEAIIVDDAREERVLYPFKNSISIPVVTVDHGSFKLSSGVKNIEESPYVENIVSVANLKNLYFKNIVSVSHQLSSSKFKVIHNGVDTKFFIPDENYVKDPFRIKIFAPNFNKQKSLIQLLLNSPPFVDITFTSYEDGERRLQKGIPESLKVTVKVDLTKEELLKEYQNCDVVVTTKPEGFGYTQIEALSCGKPVVGFFKGGSLDIINSPKIGFIEDFRRRSSYSLYQRLEKLLETYSPEECRKRAVEDFNNLKMAQEYLEYIKTLSPHQR